MDYFELLKYLKAGSGGRLGLREGWGVGIVDKGISTDPCRSGIA